MHLTLSGGGYRERENKQGEKAQRSDET